jgi:hypothetical protein
MEDGVEKIELSADTITVTDRYARKTDMGIATLMSSYQATSGMTSYQGILTSNALNVGIEAAVTATTAVDDDTILMTLDADGGAVQITLPEATGSGRVIIFVCIDADNATTVIREGTGVINAAGTTLTFDVWENAIVADIGADQWALLAGTAALT